MHHTFEVSADVKDLQEHCSGAFAEISWISDLLNHKGRESKSGEYINENFCPY